MRAFVLSMLLVILSYGTARADEGAALVLQGTMLAPVGEKGRVSSSYGWGAEIRIVPDDPLTMSFGGYAVVGRPDGGKEMRDVYSFTYDVAWQPGGNSSLRPFLGCGMDVLWVNTRFPDSDDALRGTTLGLHARAGVIHPLSKRWHMQVTASYLGAIVPGTGDDLGGLILQAGLGKSFED
jgi:hypothetical protein